MISVRFRVMSPLTLADRAFNPYIDGAKLRCASGAIIPGALSILQGTVPGRVRGSGHMVPTYFRRELRDRALQRPLRLRTLFLLISAARFYLPASPPEYERSGYQRPCNFRFARHRGRCSAEQKLHDG